MTALYNRQKSGYNNGVIYALMRKARESFDRAASRSMVQVRTEASLGDHL